MATAPHDGEHNTAIAQSHSGSTPPPTTIPPPTSNFDEHTCSITCEVALTRLDTIAPAHFLSSQCARRPVTQRPRRHAANECKLQRARARIPTTSAPGARARAGACITPQKRQRDSAKSARLWRGRVSRHGGGRRARAIASQHQARPPCQAGPRELMGPAALGSRTGRSQRRRASSATTRRHRRPARARPQGWDRGPATHGSPLERRAPGRRPAAGSAELCGPRLRGRGWARHGLGDIGGGLAAAARLAAKVRCGRRRCKRG